jgi:hypothetical protein
MSRKPIELPADVARRFLEDSAPFSQKRTALATTRRWKAF